MYLDGFFIYLHLCLVAINTFILPCVNHAYESWCKKPPPLSEQNPSTNVYSYFFCYLSWYRLGYSVTFWQNVLFWRMNSFSSFLMDKTDHQVNFQHDLSLWTTSVEHFANITLFSKGCHTLLALSSRKTTLEVSAKCCFWSLNNNGFCVATRLFVHKFASNNLTTC